ncbi:hypothetical protein ACHAWX_006925 [Stephanocyclus meneghinianus]
MLVCPMIWEAWENPVPLKELGSFIMPTPARPAINGDDANFLPPPALPGRLAILLEAHLSSLDRCVLLGPFCLGLFCVLHAVGVALNGGVRIILVEGLGFEIEAVAVVSRCVCQSC